MSVETDATEQLKVKALKVEVLKLRLRDYLSFRHFFRHGYELKWNEIHMKLTIMPETLEMLRQQLMQLFAELS